MLNSCVFWQNFMDRVKVHDKFFVKMMDHSQIETIIDRVAEELNKDYAGCTEAPVLLCTLNGALPFCGELMTKLHFDPVISSIKVSSYSGMRSSGALSSITGPTISVVGKEVIIVEDIVDTGITLKQMRKLLELMGAKSVKCCTLLFKPEKFRDEEEKNGRMLAPEYIGKSIENKFILGFGLDYDELGRCYRDIYVLDE